MWFLWLRPIIKAFKLYHPGWYVATKDNSLSFFYFCLRADYIVLSLCGAQCNWSGRFIRCIQYLVGFQRLQGLLPWNRVYVFYFPLGKFCPHLTSKKEGDQTPEWTQTKLIPQGDLWGKGLVVNHLPSGIHFIHVGLKITSQRRMILDPLKHVATSLLNHRQPNLSMRDKSF